MKTFATVFAMLTLATFAAPANAHYTAGCKYKKCMVHVIKPYVDSFLRPVGHCESARYPGGYSLKAGLHVISPGGKYRGRYQFDFASWHGAGAYGDPVNASWYEQAYRAVVWLHRAGRGAWPNC